MARRGLERADVALLGAWIAEQALRRGMRKLPSYAEESGKSVVIVMNKWDWQRRRLARRREGCGHHKGKSETQTGRKHKSMR